MQELQESIREVPLNNAAVKHDKYDTVDCPDSEQLAVEILAELKRREVTVNHQITKEDMKPETETKILILKLIKMIHMVLRSYLEKRQMKKLKKTQTTDKLNPQYYKFYSLLTIHQKREMLIMKSYTKV